MTSPHIDLISSIDMLQGAINQIYKADCLVGLTSGLRRIVEVLEQESIRSDIGMQSVAA